MISVPPHEAAVVCHDGVGADKAEAADSGAEHLHAQNVGNELFCLLWGGGGWGGNQLCWMACWKRNGRKYPQRIFEQ